MNKMGINAAHMSGPETQTFRTTYDKLYNDPPALSLFYLTPEKIEASEG